MADPKDITKQKPTSENGRAVTDTKQPQPTNESTRKADPSRDAFSDDEEE